MNTVIYITVVTVTDWPRLVWRCVAALWVWPWRLAVAAAAVPGVPTPSPVSPRPDWTPCRGDLRPSLIRRCALEGILPFDHQLGGGFAGCRCSLSVCSLLISGTDPVEISHRSSAGFLSKQMEKRHLLRNCSRNFSESTSERVPVYLERSCWTVEIPSLHFPQIFLQTWSKYGLSLSPQRTEGQELLPGIAAGVMPNILMHIPDFAL